MTDQIDLTFQQRKKGWWIESKATVPCALDKEGLICMFYKVDVEHVLDSNYPCSMRLGEKKWYFNSSRDREIAEQDGAFVYANPQVLLRHFMKKEQI